MMKAALSTSSVGEPTTDNGWDETSSARREIWMPWLGGVRPNTTVEEALFVMRLGDLADREQGPYVRSDITAVLNALRCGLLVDQLLERAPGLKVARLYGAYHALEQLRARSEAAWSEILDHPTPDSIDAHGHEAAKLLPSIVGRLRAVAGTTPSELGSVAAVVANDVRLTSSCVIAIEQAMQRDAGQKQQRSDLRRLLYDPEGAGATSRPDFLSRRVGTLVPARVAALLGEHVDIAAIRPDRGFAR
jgi:hypothetical protein